MLLSWRMCRVDRNPHLSVPVLVISSWWYGRCADDDDYDERLLSLRDVQMDWFEPAQMRCRPHSVLRVAGLTPLDNRSLPVVAQPPAAAGNCAALQALHTQLKTTCERRQSCVIDFGAVKAIRSSCRHIRYISIDVYCQPGTAANSSSSAICLTSA